MKMKKNVSIILSLLALFVLIQFIRIDKTENTIDRGKDFTANQSIPTEVRTIVKRSCYDCHSFETNYPWYTDIAPVSWWIKSHINEGRSYINFSEWENYTDEQKARKLLNSVAYIKPDQMPLSSYVSQHPEAKLSAKDKNVVMDWMNEEAEKLKNKK